MKKKKNKKEKKRKAYDRKCKQIFFFFALKNINDFSYISSNVLN